MKPFFTNALLATLLAAPIALRAQTATLLGSLGNFDVLNDTGQEHARISNRSASVSRAQIISAFAATRYGGPTTCPLPRHLPCAGPAPMIRRLKVQIFTESRPHLAYLRTLLRGDCDPRLRSLRRAAYYGNPTSWCIAGWWKIRRTLANCSVFRSERRYTAPDRERWSAAAGRQPANVIFQILAPPLRRSRFRSTAKRNG